ncbi:MAG: hypothetical protein ACFB4I_16805 [Cyanophyceae cyanobacterium]
MKQAKVPIKPGVDAKTITFKELGSSGSLGCCNVFFATIAFDAPTTP